MHGGTIDDLGDRDGSVPKHTRAKLVDVAQRLRPRHPRLASKLDAELRRPITVG